jgi:hypothetical protein
MRANGTADHAIIPPLSLCDSNIPQALTLPFTPEELLARGTLEPARSDFWPPALEAGRT